MKAHSKTSLAALTLGGIALATRLFVTPSNAEAFLVTVKKLPLPGPSHYVPLPALATGRMQVEPETQGLQHQWPGTYWEARFHGTSVVASLNDTANILAFYLDGHKVDVESRPGALAIAFSELPDREHVIRMESLTENQTEFGTFLGFSVPHTTDVIAAPAHRTRQIEVIGDSFAVGYGNSSGTNFCSSEEIWATTDAQRAWGPLVGRYYDADYQINAYSGIGMVRNYNGDPGDTMPLRYNHTLLVPSLNYADDNWHPQIIVIALGGNDFSGGLQPTEKWSSDEVLTRDFEATYKSFVKILRAKNPQARFLLLSYDPGKISETIQRVKQDLQTQGDTRVDFLEVSGFAQSGCNWHLDLSDHIKVASAVESYIDAHSELWQGN